MSDQIFVSPTQNISKDNIENDETSNKSSCLTSNMLFLKNKNSILKNLSRFNQKSLSDSTTSNIEQKSSTIENLEVCDIKSRLGESTSMLMHDSNDLKNQNTYLKKYMFPRRMWPVCWILDNYIQQENKVEKAINLAKKLFNNVQKDCGLYHKDFAAVLLLCAKMNYKLKFYKTALLFSEKALQIFQYLYGEIHIGCCVTYQLMVMIYRKMYNKKESMLYLRKAITILATIFGPTHFEIGKLYNNIGVLFEEQRMFLNAIENYLKSKEIFKNQEEEVNKMYTFNVEINIIRASYLQSLFKKEILKNKIFHLLDQLKIELLSKDCYKVFDRCLTAEEKVNFIIQNIKKDNDTINTLNNLKKITIYYLRKDETEDAGNIFLKNI